MTRVRSPMLPDVPTMAEAGLVGCEMPAWRSIMGPAGMRPEVVQILNNAIARSCRRPICASASPTRVERSA